MTAPGTAGRGGTPQTAGSTGLRGASGRPGEGGRTAAVPPSSTGPRSAADAPRPPVSHGGWDARSHALLGPRGGSGPAPAAVPASGKPTAAGPRRSADPVKALLHRHKDLCERAVDPLEIAAGLEAHGITDRIAARFRHRDVFSLAEELYARVPGNTAEPAPRPGPENRPARGAALALLPGTAAALAATGWTLLEGPARTAAALLGTAAVTTAVLLCLRQGPLRARGRRPVRAVRTGAVHTAVLIAFAVCGPGLTARLTTGGPGDAVLFAPGPPAALAVSVAPAAWCAGLLAAGARRTLGDSRRLDDFAAGMRPLLLGVAGLYTTALAAVAVATGLLLTDGSTPTTAVTLGLLLFTARLLAVHGFPEAAATGLGAACAGQALAILLLLAGRLPGLGLLARPVDAVTAAWGPGAVSALACGAAAGGLLVHTTAVLSRASAHT
ncbi:hypothetical protein [Streptomyces tsukubensis]|uniref:Integral membrane protein n=2 Tax=Streptomyces TaxID=1883 RepID=A0A7G3UDH9_STRT9|nr:hypothetical protein [Streptomyces tsukubensis]QKM67621.1 hypothetical protein STSU_011080 [Streptomyces tsukubensis NRRL18488]